MVNLTISGTKLRLRFGGESFKQDKEKVYKLAGKIPIWGIDPVTKESIFKHWEIPRTEISRILELWPNDIEASDKDTQEYIDMYRVASLPIDQLALSDEFPLPLDGRIPDIYQENTIRIHHAKTKLIIAFEQGLGKTMVSLLRCKALGFKKLLVIGFNDPIKGEWIGECLGTLGINALLIMGNRVKREKQISQIPDYQIVLIAYEALTHLNSLVEKDTFDALIIDEAHTIAHPSTKVAKNVEKILKSQKPRIILELTGTPILNKPLDLWNVLRVVSPEAAGNYMSWKQRYEKVLHSIQKKVPVRNKDGTIKLDSNNNVTYKVIEVPVSTIYQNLEDLQTRLKPYIVRVKRDGITKFEDEVNIISVPMTPYQEQLYETVRKEVLVELENEDKLSITHAFARVTRLLQVSEGVFNLDPNCLESGKLDWVIDKLDKAQGKVIVWSRFRPISEILYSRYKDKAVLYNGGISKNQKLVNKIAFQGILKPSDEVDFNKLAPKDFPFKPGEAQFWFGTISIKLSGINLPACNYQIFTSFDWNHNVNKQVEDRTKRFNQTANKVQTDYLVSGLDKKTLNLVLKKYKLTLDILDGKGSGGSIKTRDLIQVLKEK